VASSGVSLGGAFIIPVCRFGLDFGLRFRRSVVIFFPLSGVDFFNLVIFFGVRVLFPVLLFF